ncbi:MAG: PEP-CTERM sorting domain-containing protein [Bryobacteraceae bacterium]
MPSAPSVPEPATWLFAGSGFLLLFLRKR